MKSEHKKAWGNCLGWISKSIEPMALKTWFEPIVPLKLVDNVLTIQVPSIYFFEIIEEQYLDVLRQGLINAIGPTAKLVYSVVMEQSEKRGQQHYTVNFTGSNRADLRNKAIPSQKVDESFAIKNPFIIPGIKNLNVDPQLIPDYTFENFIEGDCNRLARSASQAVAKNPGKTAFNPLFIYGNSGLGKTHLAQALGIEVKRLYPGKTVLYVSANKFQTQFSDAVRNNTQIDFVNFYQLIDVLIVDDIQEFAGKVGTQNTFFHIFNHLQQTGKQIILTSDTAPAELQGMEERLLSRFKWGLPADLKMPDFQTRVNILKHKISKDGMVVPADVVDLLASTITRNVRELESALISLLFLSTIHKEEITIATAREVIDKLVKRTQKELSVDYIKKAVCDYYGLELDSLQSKTRKREIVQARQVAMYFSKSLTNSSLSSIGAKIGKKDHATVLHACKTITNLIETDREFKSQMRELEAHLKI